MHTKLLTSPPSKLGVPRSLGYSRRQMLAAVGGGLGQLAFLGLLNRAEANTTAAAAGSKRPHFPARAKRVIFLCMRGGPSHVDLFDYKPELNKRAGTKMEAGGKLLGTPFQFSQHGESGQWISELFPALSKHADDLCIINSMQTDLPNHPQAFAQLHTGSFQFVRPSLGAWTLYGLGSANDNLPGFITINPPADFGGARNYGSAFLPAIHQGTRIGGGQIPAIYAALLKKEREPGPPLRNLENNSLSREQQRDQLDLVRQFDTRKLERDQHQREIAGAIETFELAFRMQDEIPHVMDTRDEPEHVLKDYGIGQGLPTDRFGRQCLMARRFAEAGVRFVEITAPDNWDHHALLSQRLPTSCAATDQPIAALLGDLKQRGMLNDTLVIWAGEFGRTPYAQSGDGRDHNNKGYTVWLAGGGTKSGYRHGATDEVGYRATDKPVHIHDLHATILHLLGLDHERLTFDYGGRSFRLTDVYGEVVGDVVG